MKNMSKNQRLDLQKFEALISHMKFLEIKYGMNLATSQKEDEAFQLIPLYSFNKLKLRDELFEYDARMNGYCELPQIVDDKVYAKMPGYKYAFFKDETIGGELFRGTSSADFHANLLCDKEYHLGRGDMSNGIFVAIVLEKAKTYAGSEENHGLVLRLKAPDMKIAGYTSLLVNLTKMLKGEESAKQAFGEKFDTFQTFLKTTDKNDLEKFIGLMHEDMGIFAMFLGYDAIYNETYPEMAILNRSKITVSQSEYERICAASKKHKHGRGELGATLE